MNYLAIADGCQCANDTNLRGKFHELEDAEDWAQQRANQTGKAVQILRLPDESFVKGVLPRKEKQEQVKQQRKSK